MSCMPMSKSLLVIVLSTGYAPVVLILWNAVPPAGGATIVIVYCLGPHTGYCAAKAGLLTLIYSLTVSLW
jgi:hypothetical protein